MYEPSGQNSEKKKKKKLLYMNSPIALPSSLVEPVNILEQRRDDTIFILK